MRGHTSVGWFAVTACASTLFVGAGLGIAHEITLDDAINGVISDNNWDSQGFADVSYRRAPGQLPGARRR